MSKIYNEEAEMSVLGAAIMEKKARDIILEAGVNREWFAGLGHNKLWQAIEDMETAGRAIDLVTVGGEAGYELAERAVDSVVTTAHVEYHVGILRDKYLKRKIYDIALQAKEFANSDDLADDVIPALQNLVLEVGLKRVEEADNDEILNEFIDKCESGENGTLPFFCDGWTQKLGRLSDEIVFLHARRSTGKTAKVIQWHRHCCELGFRVPFFSLESSRRAILPRYLSQEGRVNTFDMRKGLPPFHVDWQKSRDATARIGKQDLCIYDGNWTIEAIRAKARQLTDSGAEGIIIDNLFCIGTRENYGKQQGKYMHIMEQIREMRNDIRKPVIVLAHPNQAGDIKHAGEVEDMADTVIFLYDPVKEGEKSGTDLYEKMGVCPPNLPEYSTHVVANFTKNREGITPRLHLEFQKDIQTFREIEL